jgi:hypothetical protein
MIRIVVVCLLLIGASATAGFAVIASASPAKAEMTTR